MKTTNLLKLLLIACLPVSVQGAVVIDLWLLQIGDGVGGAAMNVPNPYTLNHLQVSGASVSLVNSYAAPTDVGTRVTGVPNYATDGQLSMSPNRRYLVFPGYDAAVGQTGSIAGASASTVPRVVALFDTQTGTFDTSTRLTNSFNGANGNFRGATTFDGTGFWLTGNGASNFGLRYAELGSADSVNILTVNYTTAHPVIYNGELYFSRTTGTAGSDTSNTGVLKAGALHTTSGAAGDPRPPSESTPAGLDLRLPAGTNDWMNGDGYAGFQFSADGSALFVAALGHASNFNRGGVQVFRYDEIAAIWNLTEVLADTNVRQLDLQQVGDDVYLFYTTRATSAANPEAPEAFASSLWSVTYNLQNNTFSTPVELLTAPEGTVYWGVAVVPEPATVALIMAIGAFLFIMRGNRRR
jgi:hypothetical protein